MLRLQSSCRAAWQTKAVATEVTYSHFESTAWMLHQPHHMLPSHRLCINNCVMLPSLTYLLLTALQRS